MENQTDPIHDPLNNDLPHLEKECGIILNDNIWYLCRATIQMDSFGEMETIEKYVDMICKLMYSPKDEEKRKYQYSPFIFSMAMRNDETLYLYFYKFKYFDTMKNKWPVLLQLDPIVKADVLLWETEYHNWNGVTYFDSERGLSCNYFYENLYEFIGLFELMGIDKMKMIKTIHKKLKWKP